MIRLLVVLFIMVQALNASALQISFPQDSMFTCTLSVEVPVSPETLFAHFAKDSIVPVIKGAADSVYQEGPGRFVSLFAAFGYEAVAKVSRDVDRDQKQVDITVRSFEPNWKVVPRVIKGGAHYRFYPTEKGVRFVYWQTVHLDRSLGAIQRFLVRWQLQPLGRQLEHELLGFQDSKE